MRQFVDASRWRNNRWLQATAYVVFGLLLFGLISFIFGLSGEMCSEGQQPNGGHCPHYNLVFVAIWKLIEFVNFGGVAITALATVAIAGFTWTLYRATNEQGCLTQKSIELAQAEFNATYRPKLIVHAAEYFPHGNGATLIGASLLCFNTGASPARRVTVRAQITRSAALGVDHQRPIISEPFDAVESGKKMRAHVDSAYPIQDEVALQRVPSDAKLPKLYCVGTIEYFDSREMRRETGFCFVLDAVLERWISADSPVHEYAY